MDTQTLYAKLSQMQLDLEKALTQKQALLKQNQKLQEEVLHLRAFVHRQEIELTTLKDENLRLAVSQPVGDFPRAELKQKIAVLVREIDQCIACLSGNEIKK